MAINAGSIVAILDLDTGQFSTKLEKAQKQADGFAGKLKSYGGAFEDLGRGLTLGVTAPIAGLGTVATKSAIDFESAFAGVRKTVDTSEEGFKRLETGIRSMSKEIPASATAIAGVAEAAGQLGIETDNILGFTRVMIDLGEATNLSADEAATALARFANITQMSQQDFDKLGSAIVDLGNNLATTESEIVAMGLRLAGAGAQIGLTEAQIMSFAGALSSVGIEAEAGGSAFSKVMIDMQLAVETNSGRLKEFANVAGMSGEEFKKAFKEDAAGAIITFIQGLGNAEKRGLSAIKVLDDMGISEIRLRDALLRASGASEVFTSSLEIGTKAWEENTALTKEAEQRYKTTASQIEIAKNYLKDAGITIGEIVVPHIVSLAEGVKKASEWFSKLNPETQESIVKMAGLAAALGPVLFVGGKATSSIGSIVGVIGKLSGGATAATTATTAMGGSIGLAGAAAKAGALLFNPWTLGIAAAGVGAIALAKHLKEDAIPAVNLFSEETSESTKLVVSSFLELEKEATILINKLAWSSSEVTEEMKTDLIGKFDTMKNEVVTKLQEQKESSIIELQEMFANSKTISEEEKDEMIRIAGEKYDELINKAETGNNKIKKILEKAKEENRAITDEERNEINTIKEEMKETGIRLLSETEVESLAILERLKAESGNITARMAADVVKNSIEQKEKAVAEAEKEYQERLKYAATLRAEGSAESEKLADKVVEEARRQRDESIKAAEEMHEKVVTEAKNQAKEYVNEIDWLIGEVKSKWQQFAEWASRNVVKHQVTVETNYVQSRMGGGIPGSRPTASDLEKNESFPETKALQDLQTAAEEATQELHQEKLARLAWAKNVKETTTSATNAVTNSNETMKDSSKSLASAVAYNNETMETSSKSLMGAVSDHFQTISNRGQNSISIIEKSFELWRLKNMDLQDSTEELTKKLEMQKEKHNVLNEQIAATEEALAKNIAKYSEGSAEALEYKNKLLDLQIAQAKLTEEIKETNNALNKQIEAQSRLEIKDGKMIIGNVVYDLNRENDRYQERKKKDFDENNDEIMAIAKRNKVDLSVAYDMLRQNEIDKIMGKTPQYARGTLFHKGGLAWVGEQGPELIELPKGSKVYSNEKSMEMVRGESGGITQNITINSPTPLSPSEIARKNLQVSRQLAMEWGV